jgi:hypothetical protein
VLVGVPGRGQRHQAQPAEVDLVTFAQSAVFEPAPAGGRGQDRGAVLVCQLHSPGQEVRMQMGVRGEPDPHAGLARCGAHRPQVTRRVNHECRAVCEVDQVAGVAQPVIHDCRRLHTAGAGLRCRAHTVPPALHLRVALSPPPWFNIS